MFCNIIGTTTFAQEFTELKLELLSIDNTYENKIRKKPQNFSEIKQEAILQIQFQQNDTVLVKAALTNATYHLLEDQLRGGSSGTFRFDSNKPEEGSQLIRSYVLPELNKPFLLLYNKQGELLNENDITNRNAEKEYELEQKTSSFASLINSRLLYQKTDLAYAIGLVIKLKSLSQLHQQDSVMIQGDLKNMTVDTSYDYFSKKGLLFWSKISLDTQQLTFNHKVISDVESFVVTHRSPTDLKLKWQAENSSATNILIDKETLTFYNHAVKEGSVLLNKDLWTQTLDYTETETLKSDYNFSFITQRKRQLKIR